MLTTTLTTPSSLDVHLFMSISFVGLSPIHGVL